MHLTFQEFCGGLYLASLDPKSSEFQEILGRICYSVGERKVRIYIAKNITDFCCGTNPHMIGVFLQHLLKMQQTYSDNNVGHHLCHIFESQLTCKEYLKLVPIYSRTSDITIKITEIEVPYLLYLLHLSEMSTSKNGLLSVLNTVVVNTEYIFPHLSALLKHMTNLSEFKLKIQTISNCEVLRNTEFLTVLGALRKLKTLIMALDIDTTQPLHHVHDKIDTTLLLQQLTKHKQIKLRVLTLCNCLFDATVMAQFLLQSHHSLCTLVLWITQTSTEHQPVINEVMKVLPNLRVLQTLNFKGYKIASYVKYLKPIVSQLRELHLSNCALQEKHLEELFSFLNRGKKLKKLGLVGSAMSVSSVTLMIECVKQMSLIEELILTNIGLTDATACILATGLSEKSTLHILNLDGSCIGPEGMAALKHLKEQLKLHTLNLTG